MNINNDILAYLSMRTFIVFFSTIFSIILVMLALNIITVDEVIAILNLPPEAASAFKNVVGRIQEVTSNILDIVSQLLNKIFGFAGVDADVSKVKISPNN